MACSLLALGLLAVPAWGQATPPRVGLAPPEPYRHPPVRLATSEPPLAPPVMAPAAARQPMRYRKERPGQEMPPVRVIPLEDGATISIPAGMIQTVGLQAPMPPAAAAPQDDTDYQIQLTPPGPQRLFRLESEKDLQERMRQEALQRPMPERIEFPKYEPLSRQPFAGRAWPLQYELAEPAYVCYRRLRFEQINSERYGWDLGFIQPIVSTGKFFADVALLPYHMGADWRRHHECNAGYCLPGDPVPYRLYPPGLSASGAFAQAATVLAILAIFP